MPVCGFRMFVSHFLAGGLFVFVQCELAGMCGIMLFKFEDPAPSVLPRAPCASERAVPFLSSLPLCALPCKPYVA